MSANTKFAKQSIVGNLPKVGETHALSKPITSNSIPTPQSNVMKNDKVIALGMFRINPFKTSRKEKHVPNKVRASVRTKPITVSQPPVFTKKVVNSDSDGQFCDSDLEVAFKRNACFVRNLEGVDLLSGNRITNLYTINLHEMFSASPICLMARAFLPSHGYGINEHLCSSCEQGKSKRTSHPPKPVPNYRQRLHLLHMDLCGLMRIASINGKRYALVIVNDYSRYTWVQFLISKDEAPE
nr:integrase, catalytic region, zinc finger, CCHC-type, peptidase aspartic, catalytic [Tanacetum cinerariifolium]